MRSPQVSKALKVFPEPQRAAFEKLRDSILAFLPGATECIAYGMPSYRLDGDLVLSFQGFKNHNSLFPASGSIYSQMQDQLAKYAISKGTLRFDREEVFPKKLIRQIIKTRLEEINGSFPKKSGEFKSFYSNGFLKSKGKMKNDEMHGEWTFYRRDGSLMRVGKLKDGKPVGDWTTYPRVK